jgi:hypothetical protein
MPTSDIAYRVRKIRLRDNLLLMPALSQTNAQSNPVSAKQAQIGLDHVRYRDHHAEAG